MASPLAVDPVRRTVTVIQQFSWLQVVFFALGLAEQLLVLTPLGVQPSVVRPMAPAVRPSHLSDSPKG